MFIDAVHYKSVVVIEKVFYLFVHLSPRSKFYYRKLFQTNFVIQTKEKTGTVTSLSMTNIQSATINF